MNFASPLFLFAFLPLVLTAYHLLRPMRAKNALLITAGLVFYAFGDLRHLPLLAASCALHYAVGLALIRWQRGRGLTLAVCAAVDLAVLAMYKWRGTLPLGISFYTFQAISYVADVYRAPQSGTRSFRQVLQYLTFFPLLVSGPLTRFSDMQPLLDARRATWDNAFTGCRRFVCGLAKKLLFAAAAAQLANAVYEQSSFDALCAWTGAVCYCLQLYFDFSGYSDMAVGLGLLFGIRLPENFRYPYCASSLSDFWRRWHISLSRWFRDYLYIPLGGNRRGTPRTMANKLLIFLATGLWHGTGWTFVLWGLWHGLLSCLETALHLPEKLKKHWYGHVYALFSVILGFAVFRAADLPQACAMLRAMLTGFAPDAVCRTALLAALSRRTGFLCALSLVLCVPLGPWLQKKIAPLRFQDTLYGGLTMLLFVLCLLVLASSSFQPFIYAGF